MQADLCVLGSIHMDLVVRAARFPAPGETLLGRSFATFAGGKGANQAIAAARLTRGRGGRVRMAGRVGQDLYGTQLLALLAGEGVEIEHLEADPDVPTGVALITVDDAGENTIVVASGASGALTAAHVEAAASAVAGSRLLLTQLEVPLDAVAAGLRLARRAGVPAVLNAAPAQALPAELLRHVDVLITNESEARLLCGAGAGATGDELARALVSLGPRTAVVTLGARGAVLAETSLLLRQAAFAVEVLDSTAAGDAFVASLACARSAGLQWPAALRQACAAGALAATRAGAVPSLPDGAAVEAFLRAAP